ncbi:hypothetical protein IFM89_033308 [Coptis chinensis]|uniref:Transposase-associated domain-containing protein n=1 Tax=Coptis chinensis TaxID=261450 RepID=A0A835HLB0_9MAGN|nr:hypothetical protein IFM89_033308 [Coptis chinensis]
MSSVPPNRAWMKAPQASTEYLDGVISFLTFAQNKPGNDGWYCCPCVACRNVNGKKTLSEVSDHLIRLGIDRTYLAWTFHGEPLPTSGIKKGIPSTSSSATPRMVDLVNDAHIDPESLDDSSQVFYCKDPTRDNWYVVLDAPKRLNQGVDAFEDPLVFEARMSEEEMISN